jgi:integrase
LRVAVKRERREVELLQPALEALNAHKAHTLLKGAEVFQRPGTTERWPGDKAIPECFWSSALKRARVRYRNPYQTRHTYASMMLMAGENPLWLARQMGHKDASITLMPTTLTLNAESSSNWHHRPHISISTSPQSERPLKRLSVYAILCR